MRRLDTESLVGKSLISFRVPHKDAFGFCSPEQTFISCHQDRFGLAGESGIEPRFQHNDVESVRKVKAVLVQNPSDLPKLIILEINGAVEFYTPLNVFL